MGALLLFFAGAGLLGATGILLKSNKIKPITFPSTFYDDLEYFKLYKGTVLSVKNKSEDIIFEGTISSAEKYFNSVQMGFEKWLEEHDHFTKTNSTVNFS